MEKIAFVPDAGENSKQWSVQGVPSYRLYDEQGEMTKQFVTGTPTKLGNTLYLFLS